MGRKTVGNDMAADWFIKFMKKVDIDYIMEQAESIIDSGNEDELRAISYVIGCLGKNYIWPVDLITRLDIIKQKLIKNLKEMIESNSEFLELWENTEAIKKEVEHEISLLKDKPTSNDEQLYNIKNMSIWSIIRGCKIFCVSSKMV